jgi:hemoglobin
MTRTSIYSAAGGDPAFLALATAHHIRCLEDPVLNHPFSRGTRPDHVLRLAHYWAEVFGGPPRFSEAYGGHSAMLGLHTGQGMVGDIGDRFVACFVRAADDAGLPDDPELRSALRAYMEWAVAEVMELSPAGTEAAPDLAMPHWSWDGPIRP